MGEHTTEERLFLLEEITWECYNQSSVDSMILFGEQQLKLAQDEKNEEYIDKALFSLGMAWREKGDFLNSLYYFNEALASAEKDSLEPIDKGGILLQLGFLYKAQGEYSRAIQQFKKSANIFAIHNNARGQTIVLKHIGSVYIDKGDYLSAMEYLEQSLHLRDSLLSLTNQYEKNERIGYAEVLLDIGRCHLYLENIPKANHFITQSLQINREYEDQSGIAHCLAALGDVYSLQGNQSAALANYRNSFELSKEIDDGPSLANTSLKMGLYYLNNVNTNKAIVWCKSALTHAENAHLRSVQRDACECMYKALKESGDIATSLKYLEKWVDLNKILNIQQTSIVLQKMEFEKQVIADSLIQERDKELAQHSFNEAMRRKDFNRNISLVVLGLVVIAVIILLNRGRVLQRARRKLESEKNRSDNLLLNILPMEIAQELKLKGEADARDYSNVTILFTDIQQFTLLSQRLTAKEMVEELNHCFTAFDDICEEYGVEKIKTIGDSYMAAGGIPTATSASIKNTVLAALDMNAFMHRRQQQRKELKAIPFEMRIGIHTGHVVAGIVGSKKFQYDIWGDAVNTASRMEECGEVGRVNISQSTYRFIQYDSEFVFESRGPIDTKGKGSLQMYFVSRKVQQEANVKLPSNSL